MSSSPVGICYEPLKRNSWRSSNHFGQKPPIGANSGFSAMNHPAPVHKWRTEVSYDLQIMLLYIPRASSLDFGHPLSTIIAAPWSCGGPRPLSDQHQETRCRWQEWSLKTLGDLGRCDSNCWTRGCLKMIHFSWPQQKDASVHIRCTVFFFFF